VLNAIADAVEKNKDMLAVAESWEKRQAGPRDARPLTFPWWSDHFRYFAAAARAEEGRSTEIEKICRLPTSGSRWAWSVRSSRSTSRC